MLNSMSTKIVNQSYPPPKKYFGPPIGRVRGGGSLLIGIPISHFIGGSKIVKILGVQGIMGV